MYQETIDKRVIRTRMKLFNALRQLLDEKPIHSISVIEITKIAGIGRASFYRHFNSLEDILKWRIQYEDNDLKQMFLQIQDRPVAEIILFFLQAWMQRNPLLVCLIKSNRMDILEAQILEDQKALEFLIEGRISNARVPYRSRAPSHAILADNTTSGYIDTILSGLLSSILVKWVEEGKKETPEELTHIVMTTINMLAKRFNS